MIKKKYYQVVLIVIASFAMSIIMSLVITYINTGMDSEFIIRWRKAFLIAFPIAIIAAIIVIPFAKKIADKITY